MSAPETPDDLPTEPMGPDPDRPTEPLAGGDPPTEPLPPRTQEPPTERLPETEPGQTGGTGAGRGRGLGIGVLIGSIAIAAVLCGGYIALGGLDYKPSGAADPCDPRPWGSPQGLEQTAERFTLAAIDGAACELGVSREELTRALADERSRQAFAESRGLSDAEIEDALRAGLLRAVDDAENGGALQPLVATGLRFTIRTLPMSAMIGLIENASEIFSGSTLKDLGGIVDGALDLLDPGGSGDPGDSEGQGSGGTEADPGAAVSPDDLPGKVGGELTDRLKQRLPPELREQLPDDLGSRVEQGLNDLINP